MSRKPTTRSDRLAMENYLRDLLKKKDQRIAELEEQLKTFLNRISEQNKEILDLRSQVIIEKLRRE